MKSILFILPYFGRFPNYFNLFLKSCEQNSSINWLLITDNDLRDFTIPVNVLVRYEQFADIQYRIKKLYGYAPQSPYDMCKYRVAYADIFLDALNYDFWGYCDCDLIWGNLRYFFTEEVLNRYDKISWRGHMTLFKNSPEINNIYKLEISGFKTFKGCISNSDGVNLFDEVGINKIFDEEGLKIYKKIPFADLKIRSANFVCLHDLFPQNTNDFQIFRWSVRDGLERIAINEATDTIVRECIAYVHFLKRPMKLCGSDLSSSFLIVPNKFIDDEAISLKLVKRYSKKRIYWSYWLHRLNYKFIVNKVKTMLTHRNAEADTYKI